MNCGLFYLFVFIFILFLGQFLAGLASIASDSHQTLWTTRDIADINICACTGFSLRFSWIPHARTINHDAEPLAQVIQTIWLTFPMLSLFDIFCHKSSWCWEDSRALLTRVVLLCSLADTNSTAHLHSSTSGSLLLTKLLLSYVATN